YSIKSHCINATSSTGCIHANVYLGVGDVVIQNSANSGVGQAVIQIAAARKLRTINIIRDRPNLSEVSDQLKLMGATEVVTEEFAQSYRMKSVIEQMGEPTLALNGVGGKSSLTLLRLLADGGTMVTYGGMSRQPITVPTGSLIFNDKSIQGFWMTRWSKSSTQSDRQKMLNSLYEYIRSGSLKTVLHGTWKLQDFHAAVTEAMQPFHAKKQIFINET
ncbi:enoyl-[acyl-carrier-protein] reductase, mitochondrial-like, partial [Corticium candelabrum]|uniref:enoyl-[acyl-carrier-protein] reductase, mitochondrial-like n=1 Tax=Corticium candelabrum TaxID=121492 RepID=UPI002E36DCCF